MAGPAKVTFDAARWSRRIEQTLSRVPGAGAFMADWRAGVLSGRLSLWVVKIDGEPQGALVWDVEPGPALTVLALACEGHSGACVASEVARVFDGMARLTGAECLRFWTRRPGLRRIMERRGFINRKIGPGPVWMMEREIAHG